jgi:hypothetical protein
MGDKLYVYIIKKGENDFELNGISEDKILWYKFPCEYRNLNEHTVLYNKTIIKNTISAIRPINGYRKLMVKLDEDLKKVYFDEVGNLCYLDLPLEEIDSAIETTSSSMMSREENFLIKRIQDLESKLHQIETKFILEKFDKTQNATHWLEQFESECARHGIKDEIKVIETLNFFLVGSPKDWYEANLRKIGLTCWSKWRSSFLSVFVDSSWSKIRKAFNFKYLGGSLIDYALTKEKLCLEVEKKGSSESRINMIVVNLPLEIQDKLDKTKITGIDELFIELRKIDDSFSRQNKEFTTNKNLTNFRGNIGKPNNQIGEFKKKPCYICEKAGFKNRYHLANECRNKESYRPTVQAKVNVHETAELLDIELEKNSLN